MKLIERQQKAIYKILGKHPVSFTQQNRIHAVTLQMRAGHR
jgi:hypothetical protein